MSRSAIHVESLTPQNLAAVLEEREAANQQTAAEPYSAAAAAAADADAADAPGDRPPVALDPQRVKQRKEVCKP